MISKFFAVLCIFAFHSANADNRPTTEIETYPGELVESLTQFSGKSASNRAGKKYIFQYETIGLEEQRIGSFGPSFGYFITPHSILSLQFLGSRHSKSLASMNESWNANGIGISYKIFQGNSSYLSLGLVQTSGTYKYSSTFLIPTNEQLDFSALWGRVAFGSQWQWEHFSVGCDWVGFSYPIRGQVTNVVTDSELEGESSFLSGERGKYAASFQATYLHLYVGAAF
jgi:hypothetical protein